jgi:hypothetical protein
MTAIPLSTGRVRPRRRAVVTRHPPALPLAVTAVGWAVLLLLGEHGGTGAGLHTVGLHTVEPHVLDPVATAAMVVATMGPLAMPGTRTVAGCSIWWGGRGPVGAFVGAFLGRWLLLATGLAVAGAAVTWALPASLVAGLALAAAGAAQLDPARARLLAACARPMRIRASGAGALRDAARFGWSSAASCARTCALPMIAMLALPAAHPAALAVMAALMALALLDRAVHPARRPWLAAGYAALGLACVL